jgi:hypothetical protein
MHNRIRPMLAKRGINRCSIRKIALNKNGRGMHRPPVALGEVVKYDHGLACRNQLLDYHAANVSGSAGDKDVHAFLSL